MTMILVRTALAAACLQMTINAAAQTAMPPEPAASAPQKLQKVEVVGHYQMGLGQSAAASEGSVRASLIEARPTLRPAELLEFVPGLIVTQHSGDGKANQYFLRGFNLDHGTDFATWIDGMPVNMVSHAHGQGYTDLNFLIPELVQRIDYRKGPYFAAEGDFSSAGSARMSLRDELPSGMARVTVGEHGFARGLLANDGELGRGRWLAGIEVQRNDGPWVVAEDLRKVNGLLRYSERDEGGSRSLTLMGYDNRWTSTDQIPLGEVQAGRLDRYGSLNDSDGGRSQRFSLSAQQTRATADGDWQVSAYAVRSRLNLWSDFTYFLDDPVNGDQFEQAERRVLVGGDLSRRWQFQAMDVAHELAAGVSVRHDRLSPVGLYKTARRERLATTQETRLRQTGLGAFTEVDSRWTPWFRSVLGLRADSTSAKVNSSVAENSGSSDGTRVSPKVALVFGPWRSTELFLNYGQGFHSNDARGTTARLDPREGSALSPVPSLARSRGAEIGVRGEWLPGLSTSIALWQLNLDSELVYVGDAGATEAAPASRRHGVELNNHWALDEVGGAAWRGWQVDLDLSASKARFRGVPSGEDRVPGAVNLVGSLGLSWGSPESDWSGQMQMRHFGPRDLTEDGSQRSRATTLAYFRVNKRLTDRITASLDIFNLFNRRASDIDYFYESRVTPTGEAIEDRHFHPVEPRTVRATLAYRW